MLISLVKCLTYLCLDAPEVGALSDSRYEIILLLLSFIKQRLIVGGSRKDTWIAIGMFYRCPLYPNLFSTEPFSICEFNCRLVV